MHKLLALIATIAAAFLLTTVMVTPPEAADNQSHAKLVTYTPDRERPATILPETGPRYAAACGLCTDEDCCGGTENGWRLCKSDCPEGQYKCMQVATCP